MRFLKRNKNGPNFKWLQYILKLKKKKKNHTVNLIKIQVATMQSRIEFSFLSNKYNKEIIKIIYRNFQSTYFTLYEM